MYSKGLPHLYGLDALYSQAADISAFNRYNWLDVVAVSLVILLVRSKGPRWQFHARNMSKMPELKRIVSEPYED